MRITHRLDHVYPQFTFLRYKYVDKLLFRSDLTLYYSHADPLKDPPCG